MDTIPDDEFNESEEDDLELLLLDDDALFKEMQHEQYDEDPDDVDDVEDNDNRCNSYLIYYYYS